jgi:hypothetical protein
MPDGLRALGLGARVIDILDREVELVLVALWIAAILAAAVGQHPQQLDLAAVEERKDPIIEQIRRRDRRLAIVELGKGDLGVSVDEGLLINAPNSLEIADIERVLGTAVRGMRALELAMGFLLSLGFFQRYQTGLPSTLGPPGRSWLPAPSSHPLAVFHDPYLIEQP